MTVKRINAPLVLAMTLSMTGCEYLGPQLHAKLPIPKVDQAREEQWLNQQAAPVVNKTTQVELYPNGESSISQQTSGVSGGKGKGKGEYSLNFDDADLGEVAKVILSDILGKNYTISPQVTGKVTLQTTSPLTKEELMPTLDMLLSINNAAVVKQGDMYLIKPSSEAVYGSPVGGMPSGFQTRVVPVRNVSAGEVAEILKPLMPEKAVLQVDANRNILLVAGSGAELNRIMELVRIFDVDVLRGRSFGLFTPAHVGAGKIIDELEQVFNSSANKGKEGGDAGFFRFIEIERMNAILAITHNPSYLTDIENWVRRLDRTNAEAGGGVNVYRAQHVSAVDLADTLNDIFGSGSSSRRSKSASIASGRKAASASNKSGRSGTGSSGSSSSFGGGSTSSGLGSGGSSSSSISGAGSNSKSDTTADRSLRDRDSQSASRSSIGGSTGTGSSAEMPNVKIIPDEGNNALIIVASSEEYAKIYRVLKDLDVLPLQVMIDATIVEVNLTDELKYGIQWFFSHNNGGTNVVNGGSSLTEGFDFGALAADAAKVFATGGFSYAFSSKSKDINAVLNASAANDNVNVLSSPSLMVLNNQEASIMVGDSVPTLTSSTSFNTGVGSTASYQMVDTGVNLKIRPRVNNSGLVLMDISQSVNDAKKTSADFGTNQTPTITKREIQTNVAVQSGETIVLGGLIDDKNTYNRNGVPLLHELPLLGPIFGGTERSNIKKELVVLLTPRVMKSRQDAQDVTEEFKRKLTGIYDESLPVAQ